MAESLWVITPALAGETAPPGSGGNIAPGSRWRDLNSGREWVALRNAAGALEWAELRPASPLELAATVEPGDGGGGPLEPEGRGVAPGADGEDGAPRDTGPAGADVTVPSPQGEPGPPGPGFNLGSPSNLSAAKVGANTTGTPDQPIAAG